MSVSESQRASLWRAKLRSLARDHFDRSDGIDHVVPWGAALEHDGVWTALIEISPERSFGQAMVLAARNNATSLDLLVEGDAAAAARRSKLFDPAPRVWQVDGTDLKPAESTRPDPEVAPTTTPRIDELLALDDVDVVIEHGAVIVECRGLEVGRVQGEGDEQRLMVGVGAYDQGAFEVMHPHLTPTEALAEVVAQVLTARRPGAAPHPLNRLARERWILWHLLQDPQRIGLESLNPVAPAAARDGVKATIPASALGTDADGQTVLVTCSVGIDLDVVPAAADLAELHRADRIAIVLPERDHHPMIKAIAARSKRPVSLLVAPEPWTTENT